MTCIIGYIDRNTNYIGMGADSCGSTDITSRIISESKIWSVSKPEMLIGVAGSFRYAQIIRYHLEFSKDKTIPKHIDPMEFMVKHFVPEFERLCELHDLKPKEEDQVMVAYKGRIFTVEFGFGVIETVKDFEVIGGGDESANGALYAIEDILGLLKIPMTIEDRVNIALRAVSKEVIGVSAPFTFICLKGA